MTDNDCAFCQRITLGQYVGRVSGVAWFEPLNPVTPGHMLFVPIWHVEHPSPKAVRNVMFCAAHHAAARDEDYNLITSSGPAATQTVRHIHAHYVPRRDGDGLQLPWTGQGAH